jgi:glyoxylase-like metal-dependent hydrolase (beta-lactamase superfamily II)
MKISENCFIISGLSAEPPWSVNSGFIVGNHSTLVVDTGSNYLSAQTIYGYSKNVNPENKLIVVNTEPHFDHIGGNSFFKEREIDIFAHSGIQRKTEEFIQNKEDYNSTIQNQVRRLKKEAEAFFHKTKLANPNKSLSQGDKIDLGGIKATVYETPGHTPSNISIFIEPDRVLFCGDCVVTGYIPNLEVGNQLEWQTWLQSINILENLNPEIIIPGHGDSVVGKSSISKELNNMRSILNNAIEESKAPTQ